MGICKSRTISDFTFQSVKLLVRKFRGLSLQDFLEKRARELGWPVNAMVNMMRLINCRNFALPLRPASREDAKGKPWIQVVERLSQSFLAPGDEQLRTTALQCGPIVARQSLS